MEVVQQSEAMSIFNILSQVFIMLVLLLCIASIIALSVIFRKNNRNGWLAIVPLVNMYILFDIFWDKNKFWAFFVLSFLMGLLFNNANGLFICLGIIVLVIMITICAMLYAKMAKAYGADMPAL
jgi:hypothetical protein